MTTEWKDLPTMQDVAKAQADGWEIQISMGRLPWVAWDGKSWDRICEFRGRPRQPKMKKVNQLCFFSPSGTRYDLLENSGLQLSAKNDRNWVRVPSEDKEIEVPDDN